MPRGLPPWVEHSGNPRVGDSLIYFVDATDFSIYDVDFVSLAGTDPRPPAIAGLHYFGVVQASSPTGPPTADFYQSLFGFSVLPRASISASCRRAPLLESPAASSILQLDRAGRPGSEEIRWDEAWCARSRGHATFRRPRTPCRSAASFRRPRAVQPSRKAR